MKTILLIAVVVLFLNGCGEDRSQSISSNLSATGKKQWIYENERGQKMVENNFIYIPGGFDVDGDGLNEGGFWLSIYEAKEDYKSNETITVSKTTSVQTTLRKYFQVFNKNSGYFDNSLEGNSGYIKKPASSIEGINAKRVIFTKDRNATHSISPLEAVISLQNSQIDGGYNISLPSEKQWMQLVKLVINNPKNWTGKEIGKGKLYQGNRYSMSDRRFFIIENSILGEDAYVPKNYAKDVYDLSGGVAEWTSGMVKIEDRFLTGDSGRLEYDEVNSAPSWWKPILKNQTMALSSIEGAGQYYDGFSLVGANDTLAVSIKGTGNVDNYAVVARGGSNSKDDMMLVGIGEAKLSYGAGYKGPTVGFRASSEYLY